MVGYWSGKHRYKSTREKISRTFKKKYKNGYVNNRKGKHLSLEQIRNNSLSHLGYKHSKSALRKNSLHNKGKHDYLINFRNCRRSKPELAVGYILKELNVQFDYQYRISDILHTYNCDYFLPKTNTVIEVDGEYFHSLPHMKKLDSFRNSEMKAAGYNIIRIKSLEFEVVVDELLRIGELNVNN